MDIPELEPYLYHDVQKTGNTLGRGAYGTVEELEMGGTLYAGKAIHPILSDPNISGVENIMKKFEAECRLLADLRHPNIIQFMGICFLDGNPYPVLIMEKMDTNLAAILRNEDLLISVKYSILFDVSKALLYLHDGMKEPIVHRDLTARNVLLDKNFTAKIADVGNALSDIDESHSLTRAPGTQSYMPPEALFDKPVYTTSLDIFSFGHLTLYTINQISPDGILSYNYNDPDTRELRPRSEVERRKTYMDQLREKLGSRHVLVDIVEQCLSNNQEDR